MSDGSAYMALGELLSKVLGPGFDSANTLPQAMQRLYKVRRPVLELVCANCRNPGSRVGEVHAVQGRLLKYWSIKRELPRMLRNGPLDVDPEMRRFANFVYWMEETAGMEGHCYCCRRQPRIFNKALLRAIHRREPRLFV